MGFLGNSVLHPPSMQETLHSLIPGLGRSPRGPEMATQSRILAGEIPWTEEPGGLQFRRVAKSQTRLSDGAHTHHKFVQSKI